MKVIDVEQGSQAWLDARLGNLTASRAGDAFARTKTGWGASRDNYMTELLLERLTGAPAPRFVSAPMEWGTAHEQDAVDAYEFEFNRGTTKIGFCAHDTMRCGASPDRMVDHHHVGKHSGLLEVKCPESKTHLKYWLAGKVPADYRKQMVFQMWITGASWVDFVSYDPRMPVDMQLFVVRIERDEQEIGEIGASAVLFLKDLDELEAQVRGRRNMADAA